MNRPYRALRMLIVFNPTAGARRRRRLAEALRALAIAGVVARVAETGAPGDARRFAAEAAAAGETAVVAAGGDGTIAEVAAGLAGSAATLGILPFGTANVLALELGLPLGPAQAARVLAAGQRRLVWPGIARFADGSSRLFVQMLGAGFDAAVVAGLDLRLKQRIGRAAYVWQSARELCRYGFPPMTVTLDGAAFQVGSAIVTKGRLTPGASCWPRRRGRMRRGSRWRCSIMRGRGRPRSTGWRCRSGCCRACRGWRSARRRESNSPGPVSRSRRMAMRWGRFRSAWRMRRGRCRCWWDRDGLSPAP